MRPTRAKPHREFRPSRAFARPLTPRPRSSWCSLPTSAVPLAPPGKFMHTSKDTKVTETDDHDRAVSGNTKRSPGEKRMSCDAYKTTTSSSGPLFRSETNGD